MKARILSLILVLGIVTPGLAQEETGPRRVTGEFTLELLNPDGCPVEILDRKTRVADPNRYDAWAPVRGMDPSQYGRRSYEKGERQMIYDVAFRNQSGNDVTSVEFLWEAFNTSREPSFIYRSTFDAKTLRPGQVQFKHDVDFRLSPDIGAYRVSVRKVTFADGTQWVAPPPTYD